MSFHIISSRAVQESGSIISISASSSSSRKNCASCTSRWSVETATIAESRKVLSSLIQSQPHSRKRSTALISARVPYAPHLTNDQQTKLDLLCLLTKTRQYHSLLSFSSYESLIRELFLLLIADNWNWLPVFFSLASECARKSLPFIKERSTREGKCHIIICHHRRPFVQLRRSLAAIC